uniref:Uncharacterized protein n=1 Tax=viral metagenome TaxID=1070528 RepID=A0A6C0BHI8_9ZZZZ
MSGQIVLPQPPALPHGPQPQLQSPQPQQLLQQSVRAWVHFDNLSSNLSKQATNARNQKQIHEKEIQNILGAMKQQHAVLEVNGARLQFQQKESKSNLSWSWLQDQLRTWFSSPEAPASSVLGMQGRAPQSKADDLFKFLQSKRTIKIAETLEKI